MKSLFPITLAILFMAGSLPVVAQSEPAEKITVFAPYVVKKVTSGPPRAPVTTITMTRDVSYQGVDLKSEIGVTMLVGRVRQAAEDICRELDHRYPRSVYVPVIGDKDCANKAAADGMMQVYAVVAAARAN
jgi:UrcA family protein